MKIAILSQGNANYTTRRLKEEALGRNHFVRVVNYAKCYLAVTDGKPIVCYRDETLDDYDIVIPRIAQSKTKYGCAVVRQFEMQNIYTTARSIAIDRSRDKLRSYQLLAKAGIGIPRMVFADQTSSLEDVIAKVGGTPLIIKVARGTHGNGVVLAENVRAATAVMQAFYLEKVSFLVQEYIEEFAGSDIRALVVGNQVVASIKRQSLDGDFRSNTHQGGVGKLIKLTDEEERIAIKAAKAMGLPICGVDMMRSKRGPLILEVNSSASLKTPELLTGRNVAEKIIEYVEKNAKQRNRKDKVGA